MYPTIFLLAVAVGITPGCRASLGRLLYPVGL
jgi:hypothetical protein